jgi:Outer membrane protein beta-barrel domain
MKKYLFSLAILIAASISAKAQFSLGIKGGVNFSKINTDNFNESTKTGYQAGVFARVGGATYLEPELYLGSSGGNINTSNGTADVKFTTLNVPLLLGHKFGSSSTNLHIMAGPVYSYIMSQDKNFSQNFNAAYNDFGHYNNSTIGYQAGAGVDIIGLTADLRYEGGLSKLNSNYGQRANIWSVSVGFKFL